MFETRPYGAPPIDLLERVKAIEERAKARNAKELDRVSTSARAPERANCFKTLPDTLHALPNSALRTALFGVIGKGRRRFINGEDLAAPKGTAIRYKGEALDQVDLDTQAELLRLRQTLGNAYRIKSYALLKLIGLTDTGKNCKDLHIRIERLKATSVTILQDQYTYMGSLIARAAKDELTKEWLIELDPGLDSLFAADQFTFVQWDVRRTLRGHQLAQWLHGFYASHAEPLPYRVETLRHLCGSETARIDHFRENLRKALDAVEQASEKHGERFAAEIRDGLVYVQKSGSRSQRRHLAKKLANERKGPR